MMKIYYTKKIEKRICPDSNCMRYFGDDIGRAILKRVKEFSSANCLEDLRNAPGRHEELKGNRKFQLSCRLSLNVRLIYRPFGDMKHYIKDNQLVWEKITEIEIIEVVDYH